MEEEEVKLDKQDHKSLVLWATDCAEHVLPSFEEQSPNDPRPRKAVEAGRAWVRDEIAMSEARTAACAAHAAARDADHAAARAAAHAAATAHVADHAVHAAAYALTAISAATPPTPPRPEPVNVSGNISTFRSIFSGWCFPTTTSIEAKGQREEQTLQATCLMGRPKD